MKDAQRPGHFNLGALIGHLRDGRFVIPDFQREFEWKPWDVRALMRSIFLDYYIGSLLLWKGTSKNFTSLACEPIYGFEGKPDRHHIVLDGQQRLTAMYYAFIAPDKPAPRHQKRCLYFIRVDKFMEEAYDDAFEYYWPRRGEKLLGDRTAQFDRHMFPLAVVGRPSRERLEWFQGYESHWRSKEAEAGNSGDEAEYRRAGQYAENARAVDRQIDDITRQYQIAYVELDQDIEIDKVCDIFKQINSRGTRLNIFDLMNALLKPTGLQLRHLWRRAEGKLGFVEPRRMKVYVLQVMSILCQDYCSPKHLYNLVPGRKRSVQEPGGSLRKEVLFQSAEEFEHRWHEAVNALNRTVEQLQEFGAVSSRYVPYVSMLPAFAAAEALIRTLPARKLAARRKLRHWYWASVFTSRYSDAAVSKSAQDFRNLQNWFEDDAAEPVLIAKFKDEFRRLNLRRETKRGSSVYKGVFNLLVLRGARDWMDDAPPDGDLDDHHIVPKSWGKQQALDTSIDTILNRTPLTADTRRRVISDRLPNEYLPKLMKDNGEATVRDMLELHCISRKSIEILLRPRFGPSDYEEFLAERERTVREAIEDLLIKERLPPGLRKLDAQVEATELGLRKIIDEVLGRDATKLPSHVLQKIDERIDNAKKKNATLDALRYTRLAGKLEFADLRDLQGTVTNKMLAPQFRPRFPNKDELVRRFDQLAELRNGIRHSRTVDEVTRRDGETAILWFRQLLARDAGTDGQGSRLRIDSAANA